jgi:hypothetical protein
VNQIICIFPIYVSPSWLVALSAYDFIVQNRVSVWNHEAPFINLLNIFQLYLCLPYPYEQVLLLFLFVYHVCIWSVKSLSLKVAYMCWLLYHLNLRKSSKFLIAFRNWNLFFNKLQLCNVWTEWSCSATLEIVAHIMFWIICK